MLYLNPIWSTLHSMKLKTQWALEETIGRCISTRSLCRVLEERPYVEMTRIGPYEEADLHYDGAAIVYCVTD